MADVKTIKGTDLFIFEGKFRLNLWKLNITKNSQIESLLILELVEGLNTVGKILYCKV